MNAKKALAILLTAAQIIGAASLVGAAEFPEDELTAADVTIETPEFGEVTEDFGGAEEIGLIAPGDEQERVWVRRIYLNDYCEMRPDETFTLEATVVPNYANDTSLTWWVDDENIVTVDWVSDDTHQARIKAVGNYGETSVRVKANDRDGVEVECRFVVGYEEDDYPWGYEEWMSYGGHNYYRYTGRYSWETAKRYAEEMGGYLAVITSEDEWNALENMIVDRALWVGASDFDLDGNWEWVTGEPFEWAAWMEGEPNDGDEREGAHETVIDAEPGGWNDAAPYNEDVNGFVLEYDLGWIDMPTDREPLQSGDGYREDIGAAASELGLGVLWDYRNDTEHSTRAWTENESNLTFFDYEQKYNTGNFPVIVHFEIPEPTQIGGIVLTTGNDSGQFTGRNPRHWLLAATNTPDDFDSWEIIAYGDSSFLEDVDKTSYAAAIPTTQPYKYFKFEADESVNGEIMQLGCLTLCMSPDWIDFGDIGEDIHWILNPDGNLDLRGSGDMPDWSEENPAPWAAYKDQIYQVSFRDDCSIGTIGAYAFDGCSNLTGVDFGSAPIGSIGDCAFRGADLSWDLELPDCCGYIGDYAFANSNICRISMPGVVCICEGAFLECRNMRGELVIPATCQEIRARAFEEAFNGNHNENHLVIEEGDTELTIGETAFYETRFGGGIYLPDRVREIGVGAFDGACDNGELRLSASLTDIPEGAFSNDGFNGRLEIPESVTSIGAYAFAYSYADELVINEGLVSIGESAFEDTHFNNDLCLPDSLEVIGAKAFRFAVFEHHGLIFGSGLCEIGDEAFHCADFGGDLEIPDSVYAIGAWSFADSSFDGGLTLGNGCETIRSFAFNGTRFHGDLEIPACVTLIEDHAFDHSAFDGGLILHEGLKEIYNDAFRDIEFSGDLVIPDSVEFIADRAFFNDSFIGGTLTLGANLSVISGEAFKLTGFGGDLVIPNVVGFIGNEAFAESCFDGTLDLGNVGEIGWGAFKDCHGLHGDLIVPDSVWSLSDRAFQFCGFDGDLVIGENVGWYGRDTFGGNNFHGSLTIKNGGAMDGVPGESFSNAGEDYGYFFEGTLTLSEGLRHIDSSAFENCHFTGDLVIPDSVEDIHSCAFKDTGFNGTLTLGANLNRIQGEAFKNIPFTGDLVIPGNVKEIHGDAFALDSGFTSLTLNEGLETIGWGAFYGCSGMKGSLVLPNSIGYMEGNVFNSCGFDGTLDLGEGNFGAIGDGLFMGVPFTGDLVIPENIHTIGSHAFCTTADVFDGDQDNNFMVESFTGGTLTVMGEIDCIRDHAFDHAGFAEMVFENEVHSIEDWAFSGTPNCYSATFYGNAPESIGEGAFNGGVTIYYGPGTEGWSTPEWNGYPCYPIGGGIVINEQPTDIRVTPGTPVTFHVGADGVAAYQWQYSANNGGSWRNVAAASGKLADYTMTAELRHNGYIYRCMLTDEQGNPVYTDEVLLTVSEDVALAIIRDPDDQNVTPGTVVHFIVEAEGKEPLTYQWQYSKNNGTSWVNVASAAGKHADYSLTAELRHNLYLYRCKVTDADGNEIISGEARLIVEEESGITILTQPIPQTVRPGTVVHFIVEAEGNEPLTYQWQYSKNNGGSWVNVASAAGKQADYSLTAQLRHNGYLYRCVITNADGNKKKSDEVRLTVAEAEALRITSQPEDVTVNAGQSAAFTVTAEGVGTLTYQWQYSTNGGSSWVNVSAASGKTARYTLTAQARHNGYMYRCIVTDSADGASVTSGVATLTVVSASGNGFQPVLDAE